MRSSHAQMRCPDDKKKKVPKRVMNKPSTRCVAVAATPSAPEAIEDWFDEATFCALLT
jgi:hypothetical protein